MREQALETFLAEFLRHMFAFAADNFDPKQELSIDVEPLPTVQITRQESCSSSHQEWEECRYVSL